MEVQAHKLKVPSYSQVYFKEAIIKELDVSRNHTETMFRHFNIPIEAKGYQLLQLLKQFDTLNLQIFMFLAIFHLAFLLLHSITPGSDVTIHNVGINPTRSVLLILLKNGGNIQLFNQTTGAEPTASIRIQYTPMPTNNNRRRISQKQLMNCL